MPPKMLMAHCLQHLESCTPVQDGMYQYVPVCTYLDTKFGFLVHTSMYWHNPNLRSTYQYVLSCTTLYQRSTRLYKTVQCCTSWRRYKAEQKRYKQVQGGTRSALNRTNRYILVHTGIYWCWTGLFWAVHTGLHQYVHTGLYQYVLGCTEFFA